MTYRKLGERRGVKRLKGEAVKGVGNDLRTIRPICCNVRVATDAQGETALVRRGPDGPVPVRQAEGSGGFLVTVSYRPFRI